MFPYTILHTFPEYEDYLMENYMQCFGYIDEDFRHMAFGYEDGIAYNNMFYDSGPLDIVFHSYMAGIQLDIKKYIISSIDNGNYIVIFVDEYYIEGRPAYKKEHRLHDILIFGYDEEKFNYFVFGRRPIFSSFHQNQIDDAYRSGYDIYMTAPLEERINWVNEKSVILMKPRPLQNPYSFSGRRFVENLKSYLKGEFSASYDSFVMSGEKCHIGVYNTNLIKNYVDGTAETFYITYPAVHAWHESKKNVLNKLKYCYEKVNLENSKLIADYEMEVRKQAEKIRLSFLKYDRSDKLNRGGISALLDDIMNSERNIISNIYDELNHHAVNLNGK